MAKFSPWLFMKARIAGWRSRWYAADGPRAMASFATRLTWVALRLAHVAGGEHADIGGDAGAVCQAGTVARRPPSCPVKVGHPRLPSRQRRGLPAVACPGAGPWPDPWAGNDGPVGPCGSAASAAQAVLTAQAVATAQAAPIGEEAASESLG